jgi:hypothetical protein
MNHQERRNFYKTLNFLSTAIYHSFDLIGDFQIHGVSANWIACLCKS